MKSVTRVAAGRDDTLPVLTGIHFVSHAATLGLTAGLRAGRATGPGRAIRAPPP